MEEEVVLCAASAYEQKFYLNPQFESLPEAVRQELQIMCVLYTEDVGGILLVVYDEEGNLELKVEHEENDFAFDEIGSVLKIKQLQQTKTYLFRSVKNNCLNRLKHFTGCFISERSRVWNFYKRSSNCMLREKNGFWICLRHMWGWL